MVNINCWLLVFIGLLVCSPTNATDYTIIRDDELSVYHSQIDQFWESTAEIGILATPDGVNIAYAYFLNPESEKTIVIVSGRTESYLKYKEVVFNFFSGGYNVFIYDHRGQGFSDRLVDDREKGYVLSFNDYVQDLNVIYDRLVQPRHFSKVFLVSHSMGGTVAARYIQKYPDHFDAVVFSSPMFGMVMPMPKWLACGIVRVQSIFGSALGKSPFYAPGQKPYSKRSFSGRPNDMTHSKERIELKHSIYETFPDARLGGVTTQWLVAACRSLKEMFGQLDKITTPLMVLQSGDDSVVTNKDQSRFCKKLTKFGTNRCHLGGPIHIEGAFHELLMEVDQYRVPAFRAIFKFLSSIDAVPSS